MVKWLNALLYENCLNFGFSVAKKHLLRCSLSHTYIFAYIKFKVAQCNLLFFTMVYYLLRKFFRAICIDAKILTKFLWILILNTFPTYQTKNTAIKLNLIKSFFL